MADPEPNILSFIASELKAFLVTHTTIERQFIHVGPPADADPEDSNINVPSLNLFFYRIEPSGFYSDSTPQDPFYIRIQCLITAFGRGENSSEGETNLRLLGNVIRVFHEHPVQHIKFAPNRASDAVQTALQVIFKPFSSEEINQIWSTQSNVSYRTSLVYELALAPITPSDLKPLPSLVGSATAHALPSLQKSDPPTELEAVPKPFAFMDAGPVPEIIDNQSLIINGSFEGEGVAAVFVLETTNVKLSFTAPASVDPPHTLQVFERTADGFKTIQTSTPFTDSNTHDLALPTRPGEFILIVESEKAGELTRSNVLSVNIHNVIPRGGDGP